MKKFILLALFIYLVGLVTAFIIRDNFTIVKTNQLSFNIADLAKQTDRQLFFDILKNNSLMFFTGIFGFLTLGLLTALMTFYNGFVFGYLLITLNRHFKDYTAITQNVLPHSIEILGLILSSTIGFYLSSIVFKKVFLNKNTQVEYKKIIYNLIVGYLLILTAAFIESYVSAK